ncbi:hypothetical protein JQ609_06335 [Bradyrhizobium sp. AUGA SZCCT0169]|jgi:hypothetical protein|nr:hypothetical protein [Bradyrhizobium sp. AUGA SZCCT0169]MBR1246548.1 hypothetical protein [Bradyrhizobium sp. AUGA SZCCT0169]
MAGNKNRENNPMQRKEPLAVAAEFSAQHDAEAARKQPAVAGMAAKTF